MLYRALNEEETLELNFTSTFRLSALLVEQVECTTLTTFTSAHVRRQDEQPRCVQYWVTNHNVLFK